MDPFQASCDALSGATFVAFTGREAISEPFVFNVFVSVAPGDVPERDDVIGSPLTLTVVGAEEAAAPQQTHGIVSAMESVREEPERSVLRLEVRPKLWFLGLSEHSRVFTEMTVEDVVKEVFSEAGLEDYDIRLAGSHPTRPHQSQYKESDLAFVQRLLERDGIFYFFEHTADTHTLVITDDPQQHVPSRGTPVRYHPVEGGDLGGDFVISMRERRSLTAKSVTLTDYDYEKPALDITGEQSADGVGGKVVVHDAGSLDPGDAKRLAKIRVEALKAHAHTFSCHGSAFHLRAGLTFELSAHPRLNGTYMVTELFHRANARAQSAELAELLGVVKDDVYVIDFKAIAGNLTYRPEQVTRRPRVTGVERGVISGDSESDYAQLDDAGRYNLKLGYDETDRAGSSSSVRTRMIQPHAGAPEGWHLPLRSGTEVMVGFIAGDPDRPIIAGAVPNAHTPSVVTSSNHTKNIFHSGGDNHIEIEDQDGAQWVDVRSPTEDSRLHLGTPHDDDSHYVVQHTDADCRFKIGTDQDILVGATLTEDVTKDVTEKYNTSQESDVKGPQTTIVLDAVEETYEAGHETTVTDSVTEIYVSSQTTTVEGKRTENYNANQNTVVIGGTSHTYDKQTNKVDGANSLQVGVGPRTDTVPGACDLTVDGSVKQLFGPTTILAPTLKWTAEGSGFVFTPLRTVILGSHAELNADRNEFSLLKVGLTGMAVALVSPLKFELNGLAIGMCGAKFETAMVNVAFTGSQIGIRPLHIELDGVKLTMSGFKKIGV